MRSYCKLKSRHGWHIICPGKRMDQVLCPKIGKCAGTAIPYTTDRDAMRFHWRRDEHSPLETLRFTRALFGLTSSPFLLGGVIEAHLSNWEEKEPEVVERIRKELYVDDLISGSITVHKAREVKDKATVIFQDACFTLDKFQFDLESVPN